MSLHEGDKRAAFIGMIVTSALLFVLSYAIVQYTNAKFEGHKAEAKAGAATKH
jgi:hypothetical protein